MPLRSRSAPKWAPEPPVVLPPAAVVRVPGRGELFVRDTGGSGAPVCLLHGWTASGELNFYRQFDALRDAGYRAVAVDHRGHGRGMRTYADFRLTDCADDAVAVMQALGLGAATYVGYSMGGPLAQLAAQRHPDAVRAIVCCATSSNWRSPRVRLFWRTMAWYRLWLGIAPYELWRGGLRLAGLPDDAETTWVAGELVRGSARDIAEAGRELGRFDSRPWLGELRVPSAVVLTRKDQLVPPRWQRDLAKRLGAPVFESPGDHLACARRWPEFNQALLAALAHVGADAAAPQRAAA